MGKSTKNMLMMVMGSLLLSSGCISVPKSPSPRFYALQTVSEDSALKKISVAGDALIGIGPVKIPEYLNRPQIVTQSADKTLKFSQFDRWGESLDLAVARLTREDLNIILPDTKLLLYPWNAAVPIRYRISIEIVQLDSVLDGDLTFAAQWLVIDMQRMTTLKIKRTTFKQAIMPQDYFGLVKALSAACAVLSHDIADTLAMIKDPA